MKLMICPECKEVIPDGKLCGNNPQCHACQIRQDGNDLMIVDTDQTEDNQNYAKNPNQIGRELSSADVHNMFYGEDSPMSQVINQLPGPLRNMMQSALNMAEEHQKGIPIIHDLSELKLVPGAVWEDSPTPQNDLGNSWENSRNAEYSWDDSGNLRNDVEFMENHPTSFLNQKTLVLHSQASKNNLILPIVWLGIMVIILVAMLEDFDPASDGWSGFVIFAIFAGIGLVLLYLGIMTCYAKTWIDVSHNTLTIERGLRRKGKTKSFLRNPTTAVTMSSNVRINGSRGHGSGGTLLYGVCISDGKEVKVANGLLYHQAHALVTMLKTLLAAEI